MSAYVQVISSHAVFAGAVAAALAHDSFLRRQVSVGVGSALDPANSSQTALFVIDLCCPGPQPSALCRLLRGKYPVCEFVCLISPEQAREDFMLGLFFAGEEQFNPFVIITFSVGESRIRVGSHRGSQRLSFSERQRILK